MTNLTEKWKKGNLENGYYYVNTIGEDDNNIYEDSIDLFISNMPSIWLGDVTRVKAVVPNLWEWENLQEENDKLKELLKECRDEVKVYIDIPSNKKTFSGLIAKINQVLGEE